MGLQINACQPCIQCLSGHQDTILNFVKDVVSIVALPLSALTFYLGYRQREYERQRSYYQEVVVDEVLPDVLALFDEQSAKLTEAGREAFKGNASARKTIPRACSVALADFAQSLFALQDRIVQRAAIFDEQLAESVSVAFQETQDSVTSWFDDVNLHKRRDIVEIDAALRNHERALVRIMYRGGLKAFRKH